MDLMNQVESLPSKKLFFIKGNLFPRCRLPQIKSQPHPSSFPLCTSPTNTHTHTHTHTHTLAGQKGNWVLRRSRKKTQWWWKEVNTGGKCEPKVLMQGQQPNFGKDQISLAEDQRQNQNLGSRQRDLVVKRCNKTKKKIIQEITESSLEASVPQMGSMFSWLKGFRDSFFFQ